MSAISYHRDKSWSSELLTFDKAGLNNKKNEKKNNDTELLETFLKYYFKGIFCQQNYLLQ